MTISGILATLVIIYSVSNHYLSQDLLHKCCRNLIDIRPVRQALGCWFPAIEVERQIGKKCDGVSGFHRLNRKLSQPVAWFISLFHGQEYQCRESGSTLEKPNLHLMLELFAHKVPVCEDVLNVSQLHFESYRQNSKHGQRPTLKESLILHLICNTTQGLGMESNRYCGWREVITKQTSRIWISKPGVILTGEKAFALQRKTNCLQTIQRWFCFAWTLTR